MTQTIPQMIDALPEWPGPGPWQPTHVDLSRRFGLMVVRLEAEKALLVRALEEARGGLQSVDRYGTGSVLAEINAVLSAVRGAGSPSGAKAVRK